MKIIKKILAILSLLLIPILLPIVIIIRLLIMLFTWWKEDDVPKLLNPLPNIIENFNNVFWVDLFSSREVSYIEKYFDEPKWWFFYMIRAKFKPNIIQIWDIKKIWKDQINIKFWFRWIRGAPGKPDPKTWETPHFSYNVWFQWTIICKEILNYENINNIKDFWDLNFQIKRKRKSKTRTIFLTRDNLPEQKIIIKCNKLYIKEEMLDMYIKNSDWKLIPFKDRN